MPETLKSQFNAPRSRRNDSEEASRVSEVAGNSQKPPQRPEAAKTAPKKRESYPRLPATLKSRFNAPQSRRNDSEEARRVSAVAGNSQKIGRAHV